MVRSFNLTCHQLVDILISIEQQAAKASSFEAKDVIEELKRQLVNAIKTEAQETAVYEEVC